LTKKVEERTKEISRQKELLEMEKENVENKTRELEKTLTTLKQTQSHLVQSEKMASIGLLTAGIAHEINNPINFVSGNVNPLKRNFNDVKKLVGFYEHLLEQTNQREAAAERRKELNLEENFSESEHLLEGIEEGSRRTALIVKGLRNFSRLDTENMKRVNINDGIESTLPLIQNKLSEKNIEVIKSLGSIPEIEGYPGQLNQVFMNLLTNAIDAINVNGKIFITTWSEKNFAAISIRDTGKGMSEEVKQKIFDPFFTTKEVGKGTGLGLSISYGIIEKHKGKIEVKSESGKGTEFIILLPV
jgi:signal transduction histidine kinase